MPITFKETPKNFRVFTLGFVASVVAAPALGHHTHAMFDFDRRLELEGTIKSFKWTNPHSWIHVTTTIARGEPMEYALELSSPARLVSRGWKPTTLAPGDKVSMRIHPTKGGGNGGTLISITLPDGRTLGHEND